MVCDSVLTIGNFDVQHRVNPEFLEI